MGRLSVFPMSAYGRGAAYVYSMHIAAEKRVQKFAVKRVWRALFLFVADYLVDHDEDA